MASAAVLAAALAAAPTARAEASAVTCAGLPVTIEGTARRDVLVGTPGDDVISGGSGADRIHAGGGDDVVCGGRGADRLLGEEGNDRLIGGGGADRLFGGPGAFDELSADRGRGLLDGGPGDFDRADFSRARAGVAVDLAKRRAVERRLGGQRDRLRGIEVVLGTAFADVLLGDPGANVLAGGGGSDLLDGRGGVDLGLTLTAGGVEVDLRRGFANGEGQDRLESLEGFVGGAGNDLIVGGPGAETLVGGVGPDRLLARGGDDALFGGWGEDHLRAGPGGDRLAGDRGPDELLGGGGFDVDVAAFGELDRGIFVDLQEGYAMERVDSGDRDRLRGIEGAQGTSFADVLLGTPARNSLEGGAGADDLRGYAGDDYLFGGWGVDEADGWEGLDTCYAETARRCERPGEGNGPETDGSERSDRAPETDAMRRAWDSLVEGLVAMDAETGHAEHGDGEGQVAEALPADVTAGSSTCRVTTGGPSELTITAPTSVASTSAAASGSSQTVFWQPVVYRWTGSRWELFSSQRYFRGLAFGQEARRAAGPLAELVGVGGPLQAGPAAAWHRLADDSQATALRLSVPVDAYYTVLHYVEWAGTGGGFALGPMRTVVAERGGALTGPPYLAPWCRS